MRGVFGWLGQRSGTFDEFRVHEVPYWFVFLAIGLVLYAPSRPPLPPRSWSLSGSGVVLGRRTRLFAAIGLPVTAMLLSIAFVSASFDVDGIGNLNERYVLHVVPLTFVGLALWIERELRGRVPGHGCFSGLRAWRRSRCSSTGSTTTPGFRRSHSSPGTRCR